MQQFFEDLKRAREAKGISLSDISDMTLIGLNFLEALEKGNTSILPETYIRAFIREYADAIGLDPGEVMKKYDALSGVSPVPVQTAPVAAPVHPRGAQAERHPLSAVASGKFALLALGLIASAVIVWNYTAREPAPTTQEIPFQSVIKENEQRFGQPPSLPQQPPARVPAEKAITSDSLTLLGVTIDSVWVQIIVDKDPPREYIIAPNRRVIWKAGDRFTVTLGNAGGIRFTLNNKDLGTLGKRGAVVRNAELNRRSIAKP